MKIRVEVVYALPNAQTITQIELESGARVADALAACGTPELLPGRHIGIWGVPVFLDTELRDRDRVEIYRELVADPKQARRQRARQQRGKNFSR
jgi:putative ubiquitin-RnfH superfamily antitoxin RatB of RatAB toxin-antitoxin module